MRTYILIDSRYFYSPYILPYSRSNSSYCPSPPSCTHGVHTDTWLARWLLVPIVSYTETENMT